MMGASVGSFLNVVIYRLPEGESIVRPGSHCPKCKKPISMRDNIPILGWLLLRGRGRCCGQPISIQYPLIELAVAALAVACWTRFGMHFDALYYFVFCSLLVAVTFIDLPYQIIPHELSVTGIVLGLAGSFLSIRVHAVDSAMGALSGFLVITGIIGAYYVVRRTEGMGMGDAFLLAMIGSFLGWQSLIFVIFASSAQGAVVSLLSIWAGFMKKAPPLPDPAEVEERGPLTPDENPEMPIMKAAVPFGPFLALAALEWLFFGDYIAHKLFSTVSF